MNFFRKGLNLIDSNPKVSLIFYSMLTMAIWENSSFVLSWLGKSSLNYFINFIDSLYVKAATLEPTNYSYFIILTIFVGLVIGWIEVSGKITKNLKVEERSKKLNEPEEAKPTPSWAPKAFTLVKTVIYTYLMYGLLIIAGESTVLNTITDFNQHIRILTPYMTENERKLIISEWSQMRSSKDHQKIYDKLIAVADKNDIKLYRNHHY
ncbi:hypothetical protein ACSZNV_10520 [Aeromonas hydrophila]|uniref:hypothetical protein n=1 Tax=Aeromonas hydrophila TaxID=644 RepID=UPI001CC63ECE|nr:hypothetical protein [Aeromonas hydrophila]GJC04537.1 hypothetical protein KAM385_15660 [Aeromonas hydrophila]